MPGPLLTATVVEHLRAALDAGARRVACSLDLERSRTEVEVHAAGFTAGGRDYPWPARCRDRTVYHWTGEAFEPVSRFATSLVKLVPTEWGPPTFEIDGIKMLPTAQVSPWEDAGRKVALVEPRGRVVLDTCGGLGYFAARCLGAGARQVLSWEKNPDVLWLREINPWSPRAGGALVLTPGDIVAAISGLADASVDAALHDPPRFGIAGELYAAAFYAALARVLRPGGRLFHYTGAPNSVSRGRDLAGEVAARLRAAGFDAAPRGDGVLATLRTSPAAAPRYRS